MKNRNKQIKSYEQVDCGRFFPGTLERLNLFQLVTVTHVESRLTFGSLIPLYPHLKGVCVKCRESIRFIERAVWRTRGKGCQRRQ